MPSDLVCEVKTERQTDRAVERITLSQSYHTMLSHTTKESYVYTLVSVLRCSQWWCHAISLYECCATFLCWLKREREKPERQTDRRKGRLQDRKMCQVATSEEFVFGTEKQERKMDRHRWQTERAKHLGPTGRGFSPEATTENGHWEKERD